MRYNIDFNKLIVLLLPTFLRNSRLIGFLRAAVNPLSKLYDDFNKYRTEDHKRLDHLSQPKLAIYCVPPACRQFVGAHKAYQPRESDCLPKPVFERHHGHEDG